MTVRVNGEELELAADATVASLVALLKLDRTPCAVEVNEALVPKARHGAQGLSHGDVVEIVTLVGGG
jgi:thiamine biosynthesis protein ThiS